LQIAVAAKILQTNWMHTYSDVNANCQADVRGQFLRPGTWDLGDIQFQPPASTGEIRNDSSMILNLYAVCSAVAAQLMKF
jgi:hypothetical protein